MDNKRKSIGRIILIVCCILVAAVIITLVASGIYLNRLLNLVNRPEPIDATLSSEEIDRILSETDPVEEWYTEAMGTEPEDTPLPTEMTEPTQPQTEPAETEPTEVPTEEAEVEAEIINILLIGQDRRQGQERQRSDAMILCTVNTAKKTVVLTSFLRDTYVEFPYYNGGKYKSNRLNVPYVLGGMGLLDATLEHNFGVHVDYNVEVDFSGFKTCVNMVGGVEIKLSQKEADLINDVMESDDLEQGMNLLSGEQALIYARIRKLDGDIERTNRQRKVLNALLYKVRHLPLTDLMEMAEEILPLITTDMTNEEIFAYMVKFFPILKDLELTTQYIPAKGTFKYDTIDGMSVIVPNLKQNRRILKETIG